MTSIRLSPQLDAPLLAARFAQARRLQIDGFLDPHSAKTLAAEVEGLDWRLVLNSGARHADLSRAHLTAMGEAKLQAILAEVGKNAATSFQYLYENYPVADIHAAGQLNRSALAAMFDLMNAPETLALLRGVTGLRADFCDMQATRYGPGHFLTVHDDDAGARNRTFAYVLGLTEGWSPVWGGQLQFLDSAHSNVEAAFVPRFNTLSIFAVPAPHHVSQVAGFAPKGRVSLTGWFRTH